MCLREVFRRRQSSAGDLVAVRGSAALEATGTRSTHDPAADATDRYCTTSLLENLCLQVVLKR